MDKKVSIKRQRIKISNYDDFNSSLKKEGYKLEDLDLRKDVLSYINESFLENNITYKVSGIKDFINYIEELITFEKLHNSVCEMLRKIKVLEIKRLEYERERGLCDDVSDIIPQIIMVKNNITETINTEDIKNLEILEKEIECSHIYSRDIELLKRIVINDNNVSEEYNKETKIKIITIEVPSQINKGYIKAKKGSVEYHMNLKNSIARMKRLIRNLNNYMIIDNDKYIINQSNTLQDSINIAEAFFNGSSFKAVSGSNEIEDYNYLKSPIKPFFKSMKVNKLGKLGTGYNRVNDSEKKILEEIHREIENGELQNKGTILMYTKWESCPSCCYVISQFLKVHPLINIEIKYIKKYGNETML